MVEPVYPIFSPAIEARFWAKVDKRGADECWSWLGSKSDLGAGSYRGKPASHFALHFDGRPRPGMLWALHSCDHHPCVNPAHLRWGTREDNTQDYRERGHIKRAASLAIRKAREADWARYRAPSRLAVRLIEALAASEA